jgi:hypothetical protein
MGHHAEACQSRPGRCWRFVYPGPDDGRPTGRPEPVAWVGVHTLKGGKRIRVWSCDGHPRGVEEGEGAQWLR